MTTFLRMTLPWVLLPLLLLAGTRHVGGYTFKLHQTKPTPQDLDLFREDLPEDPYVKVVIHQNRPDNFKLFTTCLDAERTVEAQFHYITGMDGVPADVEFVRWVNNDTSVDFGWVTDRSSTGMLDCANKMAKLGYNTWYYREWSFLVLWNGRNCIGSKHQPPSLHMEQCTDSQTPRPYYVRVP